MKILVTILRWLRGFGAELQSAYYMDHNMRWRRDGGIPRYVKRHIMAARDIRAGKGDRHES